jgi:hypothetical protein
MKTFSSPPKHELIRYHEVILWLGITECELKKLVEFGLLHRIQFRPNAKGYYRASEIRQLIENQSIPPS